MGGILSLFCKWQYRFSYLSHRRAEKLNFGINGTIALKVARKKSSGAAEPSGLNSKTVVLKVEKRLRSREARYLASATGLNPIALNTLAEVTWSSFTKAANWAGEPLAGSNVKFLRKSASLGEFIAFENSALS